MTHISNTVPELVNFPQLPLTPVTELQELQFTAQNEMLAQIAVFNLRICKREITEQNKNGFQKELDQFTSAWVERHRHNFPELGEIGFGLRFLECDRGPTLIASVPLTTFLQNTRAAVPSALAPCGVFLMWGHLNPHEDQLQKQAKAENSIMHASSVTDLNRAVAACSLGVLGQELTRAKKISFQNALNTAVSQWIDGHVQRWPFLGCHEISITVHYDRDLCELKMSSALRSFIDGRTE